MESLYSSSFSFHVSFFIFSILPTDYKWVEIIHVLFSFIYSIAEDFVSYQDVLYCLAEISMGLFEKVSI